MKQVKIVHAIINENEKFLLGKRSVFKKNEPGLWAFIGGRLEHGESLEAALIRECVEEIDVTVRPIKKIKEVIKEETAHYWFEVEIVSGVPRLANDEHSELNWFTKLEANALSLIDAEDLEIISTY